MTKHASKARIRSRPSTAPAFIPPYSPSLIDRLLAWLDHRRLPPWAILLVAALLSFLVLSLVQWSEGAYPVGIFRQLHFMAAAYVPFILWLIRLENQSAAGALREFRPALRPGVDPATLEAELTTLPRRSAIAVGATSTAVLGLAAWTLIGDLRVLGFAPTPLSGAVVGVLLAASWWITGIFVYKTVRQLAIIYRTYTRSTRIDFFHLTPLSAFSRHTQRVAIAILIFLYVQFLGTDSGLRTHPLTLATGGILTLLAVVAFAGPLGGAHRLMAAEKTRLLDENARRLEAGFRELQRKIDTMKLSGADDLNKILGSLELERAALQRIPTWPWEPGTIRGLAAAFLAPLILWLLQYALQRILE